MSAEERHRAVSEDDVALEPLRRAFADGPARTDCPTTDELWRLAAGELDGRTVARLADHLARCSTCVVAVRLARALVDTRVQRERAPRRHARAGLVAALAAVAAVVLVWLGTRPPAPPSPAPPSSYRGEPSEALAPIEPARTLAEADGILRWHPGPDGTRYDVEVLSASLDVVVEGKDLATAEFLVPADALAGLEGDVVLWRVEARWPDGRVVVSSTWTTTLE
jgi:hypothetical protein